MAKIAAARDARPSPRRVTPPTDRASESTSRSKGAGPLAARGRPGAQGRAVPAEGCGPGLVDEPQADGDELDARCKARPAVRPGQLLRINGRVDSASTRDVRRPAGNITLATLRCSL